MKITKTSRKKLAEKSISWEECYTPDTAYFKAMYDDILGKGSYFRFEGKDSETGDWHCVTVGPAKMHDPEASFFAGQRKLPSTYSLSGEYFADLKQAMNHASSNWGITTPPDAQMGLASSSLKGLGDDCDKWREENSKEDVIAKFDKQITDPNSNPRSAKSTGVQKLGMATTRFRNRPPSRYFDLDELDKEMPPDWDSVVAKWPDIVVELEYARGVRDDLRSMLMNMYGDRGAHPEMHKMWLANCPEIDPNSREGKPFGSHLLSIGPYLGKKFRYASNMFSPFTKAITVTRPEDMQKSINEMINKYNEMYGVQLTNTDFILPERFFDVYLEKNLFINSDAKERMSSHLADELRISRGQRGWKSKLQEELENRQREYLRTTTPQTDVTTATPRELNNLVTLAWERYRSAVARGQKLPKPPALNVLAFGNDRQLQGQQGFSAVVKYPAFKIVGNVANGARSFNIEPSIANHGLRRIGPGSIITMATYNNDGEYVYGKRQYVVASFDEIPAAANQATITLREPLQIDVSLPKTPSDPYFGVHLINVVQRVDVIRGTTVDWSKKDEEIAALLNIEPGRAREMRRAYEAMFYGFNDMQSALDYSNVRDRPKGLDRLKVARNYSSKDLDSFANIKGQSTDESKEPKEDGKDKSVVPGVKGVPGVGGGKTQDTGVNPKDGLPQEQDVPVETPAAPAVEEEDDFKNSMKELIKKHRMKQKASIALKNISVLAQELDDQGKHDAAEEVHKVLRKYL
jgi:hypothetical protein